MDGAALVSLDPAAERYLDLLKKALTASLYDESAWSLIQPEAFRYGPLRSPLRYARGLVNRLIDRATRRSSLAVVRKRPFDASKREEGRDWPLFGYTMIGHRRLENVRACVEDVLRAGVEGDLIEAGVWRGGAVIFMRALLEMYGDEERKVWVADSFEGMPPPASGDDGPDLRHVAYLRASLEEVRRNFARFGLLDERVRFLPGWFAQSLPAAPIDKLAVLRLDGDYYSSTRDALQALYPKVSPGGHVIVDDYGTWEPCRRAVTEYLAERGLRPEIRTIDWTGVYWRVE